MIVRYVCDTCPLFIEIGEYGFWTCDGGVAQVVCVDCGVMHKLTEHKGATNLSTLPGPIHDPRKAMPSETDWQLVGRVSDLGSWRKLNCAWCGKAGSLQSRELMQFLALPDEPVCPHCQREMKRVSACVIN